MIKKLELNNLENLAQEKLAGQLAPQSVALNESTTPEFLFKNVLREKNLKPLFISFACLYMLSVSEEELMPVYIFALFTSMVISAMNVKEELYNFGLFKNNRQEPVIEIENPLFGYVQK